MRILYLWALQPAEERKGADGMDEIWQELLDQLRGSGIGEVYPSFDAVPVSGKSDRRFLVLEPTQVQYGEAYPKQDGVVYPFQADFCISVLTPMTVALPEEERFVCQKLLPALLGMDAPVWEITVKPVEIDLRLGKMVQRCTFRIKGALCVTETEVQT